MSKRTERKEKGRVEGLNKGKLKEWHTFIVVIWINSTSDFSVANSMTLRSPYNPSD